MPDEQIPPTPGDGEMPMPLEIVPDEQMMQAFTGGEEPSTQTPMGTALLWWKALIDREQYLGALQALSVHPAVWGDYSEIAKELDGYALAQNVHHCPGAEELVASVKFVPDPGHSVRAFDDYLITDVRILTLVRHEGHWLVWGVSPHFPTADEVLR